MKLYVDIRKKTGDFNLDVTFECGSGTHAILGASGCGKSMTLKCIAGIETPDEGVIILNNKVLYDSKKKINLPPQKRSTGYMFQDYALFPNMTVRKNIEIAAKGNTVEKSYFSRFHLDGLEELYPYQLSGGQKQRTAMARMLAASPEMIMLDEPFSALDSHLKWKLEKEVKQTLEELNTITLFVSHDRDEVYRLCDTVGAMENGKLKEMKRVKEFFENPGSRVAALLSGCKNIAKARRISKNRVFVPDWNIELETKKEVPDDIGYVGIRAHYLKATDEIKGKNTFIIEDIEISEDPFEWNISFRCAGGTQYLQWKVSKEIWSLERMSLPKAFKISPENILILR